MSEQIDNTTVIPPMDETSISIDSDGCLRIEQITASGEMSIVDIPAPFIPVFMGTLTSAIERGNKSSGQRAPELSSRGF